MRPAAEAEKVLGIPSVVVSLPGFKILGQLAATAAGVPDLPIVEYPGVVGMDHAEIRDKIESTLYGKIISALTRPVKSQAQGKIQLRDPNAIACTGSFEEINDYFREQEWSDGLPIVPPTIARIEQFLYYTDRSRDDVIAVLPQARLRATPWNIAANGVMAGCKPQTMPLLIAIAEALQEDRFNLENIGTTGGIVPYVLVSGPIVTQLGFHSGAGLISGGANPALGRALGLMIRNVGGYRPAKNQMGSFGYPISFAFAENDDLNPWQPLRVERGFERSTSTVSVNTTVSWGWSPTPYTRDDKTGAQCVLELMCRDLVRKPALPLFAERGPNGFVTDVVFLLSPSLARVLADAGCSKDDIRRYVCENAKVARSYMDWELKYAIAEVHTVEEKIRLGTFPESYAVGPDDMIPIMPGPEYIDIVVCGDPGRNRFKTLDSMYTRLTTREVKLPENWDSLRKSQRPNGVRP